MTSPDPTNHYEEFVELFTAHEQRLRTFVRSLVPSWHDTDEIVQEVALVAWQKFSEFERGTSFLKWACVIARFKALAHRHKFARGQLAFKAALLEVMADEATRESEQRQSEYEALETCLATLPEKQRRWITLAHSAGITSLELAEQLGLKPGTFYMRLNRIRRTLLECINRKLNPEASV